LNFAGESDFGSSPAESLTAAEWLWAGSFWVAWFAEP